MMDNKEMDNKEQELQEIAERLMQSENLAASVEILREFAEKCWQEGTCGYRDWETDRKSTRLNSSHSAKSRMPSSA